MSRHRKHCPKEGKRTSRAERDRIKTIERRATQSGMVGASDVPPCVFCGCLVPSDESVTSCSETVCRSCAAERGLAAPIRSRHNQDDFESLKQIDAFGFNDAGPFRGFGAHLTGHRIGPQAKRSRSTLAIERFALELEREEQRDASARDRVRHRAAIWLAREGVHDVATEAERIASLPTIEEARKSADAAKVRAYLKQHPRRASDMPRSLSPLQVVAIRNRYAAGGESHARLGKEFGVSAAIISQVVTGSTYKKVGGPVYWPRIGWFENAETAYRKGGLGWPWPADGMAHEGLGGSDAP